MIVLKSPQHEGSVDVSKSVVFNNLTTEKSEKSGNSLRKDVNFKQLNRMTMLTASIMSSKMDFETLSKKSEKWIYFGERSRNNN